MAECWYCGDEAVNTCPVCGPSVLKDKRPEEESDAVLGEGGWCPPVDPMLEEAKRRAAKAVHQSVESFNLELLCEAERWLCNGDGEKAHEIANRACRNLEKHLAAAEGRWLGTASGEKPMIRRGERELLALAFAHRARCLLLKQNYPQVMDDCKRFIRIYDAVVEGGSPETLHVQEKQVLAEAVPGITFLGHMNVLGAAAEIANQSRERVGHGYAPKTVMDHTRRAVDGLSPLDSRAFPGLDSLRAHLYVTRAHAGLELERWEDAKQDAELALACDPSFKEAEYMRQSAEDEGW